MHFIGEALLVLAKVSGVAPIEFCSAAGAVACATVFAGEEERDTTTMGSHEKVCMSVGAHSFKPGGGRWGDG